MPHNTTSVCYDLENEEEFHNAENMLSIGVLQAEKELVDKIIITLKEEEREDDVDDLEMKVTLIDKSMFNLQNLNISGKMTLDDYKQKIKNQLVTEKELLTKTKSIEEDELREYTIERIKNRIKIINEELSFDLTNEQTEEVQETNTSANKKDKDKITDKQETVNKTEQPDNNDVFNPSEEINEVAMLMLKNFDDLIEDDYHSYKTMQSLNVLENEKLLCNKMLEIANKESNDDAIDTLETKLQMLDTSILRLRNMVHVGKLTEEIYRQNLNDQKGVEQNLIAKIKEEPDIDVKSHVKRINLRISLIDLELNQPKQEVNEAAEEKVEIVQEEATVKENKSEDDEVEKSEEEAEEKQEIDEEKIQKMTEITEEYKDAYYYFEYVYF